MFLKEAVYDLLFGNPTANEMSKIDKSLFINKSNALSNRILVTYSVKVMPMYLLKKR